MKTGIIMEINERFLTLLTPEGEFLRAAKLNRQYVIGQEIDFYPLSIDKTNNRTLFSVFSSFKAKAAIAAALVIILVCSSVFNFSGDNEVYAYMSIDINPSIELAINDKFQVIEIKPYNEEGEQIVKHIQDWKKKDIQVITSKIVEEIKNQGYVKDNYEIIIATVNTKKDNKALEMKWDEEITEIKENIQKEKLEVKVMDASPNDQKEAKEKGLSIGSYKETQLKKKTEHPSKPTKLDMKNNEKSVENQNSNTKDSNSEHSTTPPGQLKKDHESNQDKGSDQSNKIKYEKTTPPGQEKKVERDNKNNGNKQESVKKNNNEQQIEKNKQKNNDRDSSYQRGKGKEDQSKSNGREQNKGNSNSSQGNEKDKDEKEHDKN